MLIVATATVCVVIASALLWKWWRTEKTRVNNSTGDNLAKTPYDKQPVTIHPIITSKNGNGTQEKLGYQNQAYSANEDKPVCIQPLKTEKKEQLGKSLQKRQTSDLSEVFRVPSSDDKSLSELVIEEYDNKSKTLRAGDSLDINGFKAAGTASDSESESSKYEDFKTNTVNKQDSLATSDSGVHERLTDSLEQNATLEKVKENNIPNNDVITPNNGTKTTEWREKLKRDLLDDDEEFIDESSDEDDNTSLSVTSTSDEDDNVKAPPLTTKSITSQGSSNKLLHQKAIVIDNGSYYVRGGWAGEFAPASSVRNVIGHWRAEASEAWQEALGSKFIGETAIERHSTLALDKPMEDGKIVNWRGLQQVWDHIIGNDMDTELSQHPFLVSEPATVDKKQREKMVEVFIETLRVPGISLRSQAVLSTLSSNHKVAVVINSGYGETEIVPTYEGYQLTHATVVLPIGGRHITDYLARLVQRDQGVTFTSVPEMEIMNDIKEEYATVINNRRISHSEVEDYRLPDGRVMKLGKELSLCTEPLFNPGLVGKSTLGLPQLIRQTLERVDPDLLKECDNNLLLTGGNSRIKGLHDRLQNELTANSYDVELHVGDNNSAWIGGSLFAEQSTFSDYCVTEDVYFEYGANVVHRLCM